MRVLIEIADGAVIGVRATAPGVEVVLLDYDISPEHADFQFDGMDCQRLHFGEGAVGVLAPTVADEVFGPATATTPPEA